jgi:hypothetical protein
MAVTLYRWLNGEFHPSLPKLAELADAMNVNSSWLDYWCGVPLQNLKPNVLIMVLEQAV